MPDINPANAGAVTGGGDLLGLFSDTPQAKALMKYLATPAAQAIWPKLGGAISGSKSVPATRTRTTSRRSRPQALSGAKVFRFDGSDAMPVAMSDAFLKAILDFVEGSVEARRAPHQPRHRPDERLRRLTSDARLGPTGILRSGRPSPWRVTGR